MFTKPTFGQTTSSSFGGFNTTGTTAQAGASTPFGQNAFSKPAATGTAFPTPAFGTTGSTMFGGGGTTTNTGLFGSTTTPAFGQPAQQTTTGFSGFNTGTSAPLFGSTTGVSSFAQPKPAFGGFGTNTSTSNLFGAQPTVSGTTAGQPGSSLFNQTPSLFGTGFGNAGTAGGAATQGTPIKFNPVTGTDSMAKNGLTQNINTRHQCITCMKEYENKSLEELRLEDLQAGRKGPTGGDGLFGAQPQTTQTSLFGTPGLAQPGTSTGFGENKTLFGSTVPTSTGLGGFGSTTPGFGGTNTVGGGLFGKPTGFGATTTTTASGFSFNNNTTTANPFGAAAQNKPFGATPSGSMFGAQTNAPNVFGAQSTPGFGTFGAQQQQQPQQGIGLFGQNKPTTFGLGQQQPATSSAFNFGQTTTNTQGGSLFGAKPQLGATMGTNFGSTTLFGAKPAGTTTAPAFGSTPFGAAPNTSLGGTAPTMFGQSTFGKPGTSATTFGFGQTAQGNTTNQGLSSGGLFGSNLGKPAAPGSLFGGSGGTMFGNTSTSTGMNFGLGSSNTFGNQNLTSGGLSLGQAPGLNFNNNKSFFPGFSGQTNFNQQNAAWSQDPHQRMAALLANPFERPIFNGLPTDKLKDLMSSTNPGVLKAVQSQSPSYSISASTAKPRLPVSPKTLAPSKKSLFEGLDSETNSRLLLSTSAYVTPSFQHKTLNFKTPQVENVVRTPENQSQIPENSTFNHTPIAEWLTTKKTPTSSSANNAEEIPRPRNETQQTLDNTMDDMPVRRLALDELQSPLNDSNISASPLELSEPLDEDDENSQQSPHPANIKLKRVGYFTVPSLLELAEMTDENGHCEVRTFTIGRENYGTIFFEGPLDVSNLNLDDLVNIRHREVTVYPSDEDKPPQGQGLNRPAVVTLDRVYPYNKQSRDPIMSSEALREMDYEATLMRKCTKMGATFVEYRPDTGSFVFKVQHFSKYEVKEDSDSEEVPPQEANKKARLDPKQLTLAQQQEQQPPQQQQVPVSQPSQLNLSQSQMLSSSAMSHIHYTLQGQVSDAEAMDESVLEVQSPIDHLSNHANSDLCKMRLQKVSFYADTLEETVSGSELEQTMIVQEFHQETASLFKTSIPKIGLEAPADKAEAMQLEFVQPESRLQRPKKKEEVRILRPNQHPPLVTPAFHMLPARISLNYTTSCADSALYMACKFSSTWGANATLLHSQGSSIDILTPYKTTPDFKEWVDRHMRIQLHHTDLVAEGSRISRRCTQPGLAPLENHCNVLNSVEDCNERELFIRQVLQLCLALWGPLPAMQDDAKPSVVAHKRKEALDEWLHSVIETQANEEDKESMYEDHSLSKVLQHLNRGQLLDSVRTSQDMGEHYSALVLASAGSSNTSRQLLQRQLQEWVADRVSTLVNPTRLRCWLLAGAGLPLLPLKKGDTLNALHGLDWITCLAVHFWYICSPAASIPDILGQYEEAFSSVNAYAVAPVPPEGTEESLDMRFHILKLFSQRTYSLEQLLRVESHFPGNTLDNSLSWLVMMLLDSLRYTHVDEFCSHSIHLAFSEQLEAAGLWHWAIFVLQHISNPIMRDSAVEQMLGRHVTIDSMKWAPPDKLTAVEDFVVTQLDVPAPMVFEAKAYQASCKHMYPETACFQLHAEHWSGCHTTIVDYLAADAIITRNTSVVLQLLRALRPHGEKIAKWTEQGQVILNYLELLEDVRGLHLAGLDDPVSLGASGNLEALRQRIRSTATKLNALPSRTPKDMLCQCEMSKCLLALQKSLCETSTDDFSPWCLKIGGMVAELPLPDDYRLEELQQVAKVTLLSA